MVFTVASPASRESLYQFAPTASKLKSLQRGKRQQTPFGLLCSVMLDMRGGFRKSRSASPASFRHPQHRRTLRRRRKAASCSLHQHRSNRAGWPTPPESRNRYGLAGKFVRESRFIQLVPARLVLFCATKLLPNMPPRFSSAYLRPEFQGHSRRNNHPQHIGTRHTAIIIDHRRTVINRLTTSNIGQGEDEKVVPAAGTRKVFL